MSRGVVEQVAQHSRQPHGVAADPGRCHIGLDVQRRFTTEPFRLGRHQVVQVDVVVGHGQPALVGTGQQEKVVDEGLHPVRLGNQRGLRELAVQQLGVGDRDLQRRDDRRKRAAQLVRRIADEPLLGGMAGFDAGQHLVHGERQSRYLIALLGYRHSFGQVRCADLGHPRPDASTDRMDRDTSM